MSQRDFPNGPGKGKPAGICRGLLFLPDCVCPAGPFKGSNHKSQKLEVTLHVVGNVKDSRGGEWNKGKKGKVFKGSEECCG